MIRYSPTQPSTVSFSENVRFNWTARFTPTAGLASLWRISGPRNIGEVVPQSLLMHSHFFLTDYIGCGVLEVEGLVSKVRGAHK